MYNIKDNHNNKKYHKFQIFTNLFKVELKVKLNN